ncbi:MAG: hypothetical protein R3272_04930 [Candidatus Promineifilaceae bacterium]|nr:hypothetical protein [Candidatus Promineifilaceae bacterium]
MSDDMPDITEIKTEEAQRVEIVIEEDEIAEEKTTPEADVSEALRDLGRQFAETIRSAWHSQERREMETEVREGIEHFAEEVNRVFREARESPAAKKVREEADDVRSKVERGEVSRKARMSLVDGLNWLSREMAKLAEQFDAAEEAAATAPVAEKQPEDIEIEITIDETE